jgi:hypothetical protein
LEEYDDFRHNLPYEARHRETAQLPGQDGVFPSSAKLTEQTARASATLTLFSWVARVFGIRTAPIWD